MNLKKLEQTLHMNTLLFVNNAARIFEDMTSTKFKAEPKKPVKSPMAIQNGFIAISHFIGTIQGDFIFYTNEGTAAKIAGVYPPDGSQTDIYKVRTIFSDAICEVLNVCAHDSLYGLENQFGKLMLNPPAWVFGEYHMADYISGIGTISGECGTIQCSLSINMVNVTTGEYANKNRQK
jgi:CheY-specific phosphatase CheX